MRVRALTGRFEAPGITSCELGRPAGQRLPAWSPGAHVDVHRPSGTIGQHSLCGDPADLARYRIAVLELGDGRGGSLEVHRELRPGRELDIGHPRLDFPLGQADHPHLFVAGIGITPILPVFPEVERRGGAWELVYAARSADHLAFRDELLALAGDRPERVRFHIGMLDVDALVNQTARYCGPAGLLDALTNAMDSAGRAGDLHLERFAPFLLTAPVDGSGGFEVELASSGLVVDVPADQTLLEAVRTAGVDVASSCEMGICGTCETKVLSGAVDHRDDLITDAEKGAAPRCSSASRAPRARPWSSTSD